MNAEEGDEEGPGHEGGGSRQAQCEADSKEVQPKTPGLNVYVSSTNPIDILYLTHSSVASGQIISDLAHLLVNVNYTCNPVQEEHNQGLGADGSGDVSRIIEPEPEAQALTRRDQEQWT
ncbi:hypothetical protein Q8A73_012399 [Channa argus]|nr:hypothetical protein Q8A73_012399 [Channa argus]